MSAEACRSDALDWRPDLIHKYDVAGPRYTSYPSAMQFTDGFSGEEFRQYLRTQPTSASPFSLYVHLPFCHDICYYCACNKVVSREPGIAAKYLDYLIREMKFLSQCLSQRRRVTQLHLGGGTPTYLTDAELTELMHQLASHFNLIDSSEREYSIEIDPRTVNEKTLALLRGLGFNRLSLGVQDFDTDVQRAVNRIQSYDSILKLVESIRELGFGSMSFDLIYGLPKQTPESLSRTLDQVISLSPDRISYYNYAHLPDRFPSQRAIDRLTVPDAESKLIMLDLIVNRLLNAGYRHIGMDHFVKPEDELARAADEGNLQRNFQGYSTRLAPDLFGLGVSSISSTNELYTQNARRVDEYYSLLDAGDLPVTRAIKLNSEDILRREVIMRLICQMRLDKPDIESRFGIEFDHHFGKQLAGLREMAREGLVKLSPVEIQVTRSGRFMVRNICMLFDQHLEQQAGRFSKTL